MKYLQIHCKSWCLINVSFVVFLSNLLQIYFFNKIFWFFLQYFQTRFLHKTASNSFFLCQETYVFTKIRATTCFKNYFRCRSWLIKKIADCIILVMWLSVVITVINLKSGRAKCVYLYLNEAFHESFNFKS